MVALDKARSAATGKDVLEAALIEVRGLRPALEMSGFRIGEIEIGLAASPSVTLRVHSTHNDAQSLSPLLNRDDFSDTQKALVGSLQKTYSMAEMFRRTGHELDAIRITLGSPPSVRIILAAMDHRPEEAVATTEATGSVAPNSTVPAPKEAAPPPPQRALPSSGTTTIIGPAPLPEPPPALATTAKTDRSKPSRDERAAGPSPCSGPLRAPANLKAPAVASAETIGAGERSEKTQAQRVSPTEPAKSSSNLSNEGAAGLAALNLTAAAHCSQHKATHVERTARAEANDRVVGHSAENEKPPQPAQQSQPQHLAEPGPKQSVDSDTNHTAAVNVQRQNLAPTQHDQPLPPTQLDPSEGQCTAPLGEITKGKWVYVTWSDGNRYPGQVVSVAPGQCLVQFEDGVSHWIVESHIVPA